MWSHLGQSAASETQTRILERASSSGIPRRIPAPSEAQCICAQLPLFKPAHTYELRVMCRLQKMTMLCWCQTSLSMVVPRFRSRTASSFGAKRWLSTAFLMTVSMPINHIRVAVQYSRVCARWLHSLLLKSFYRGMEGRLIQQKLVFDGRGACGVQFEASCLDPKRTHTWYHCGKTRDGQGEGTWGIGPSFCIVRDRQRQGV